MASNNEGFSQDEQQREEKEFKELVSNGKSEDDAPLIVVRAQAEPPSVLAKWTS
ncbi:hypothetical protein [Hymenobacter sp. AT01-02]|uniref:hypothetical protein n=1 Tax=Hymenobacter sp. AT01-02 TaxID=1571877 RepID=UPI000B17175F|nr:hypothetical protein [Hymenobacter sp. AT01-02]